MELDKDSQFERRRADAPGEDLRGAAFRLRFQVSLGQNDGVKKLRQLRKEIAQIKTVARERELGIHGEIKDVKQTAAVEEAKTEGGGSRAGPQPRPGKRRKPRPPRRTRQRKRREPANDGD